jgi:large subunit ribosomal protein L13
MAQSGDEHGVLEHIGVVARMKGVSVTEHPRMLAFGTPLPPQNLRQAPNLSYNRGLRSDLLAPRRSTQTPPKSVPTENDRPWKRAAKPPLQEKLMTKTFSAKAADVTHEWFVSDATDKVLGRVASEVALRLRGKHKAIYTPHVDTGDYIVIINAAKIRVTGNKALDKVYYRHSGYPGGISATNFRDMQAKHPGRALEKAVKGMLPKGPLGYAMIKKLKVYGGAEHPHTAQQPQVLEL